MDQLNQQLSDLYDQLYADILADQEEFQRRMEEHNQFLEEQVVAAKQALEMAKQEAKKLIRTRFLILQDLGTIRS